jgi:hypothetical protein
MAKGRAGRRFVGFLAFLGVVGLVVVYALVTGWNPLPAAADWLDKVQSLSEPAPVWQATVGDQPQYAVATGQTVVIGSRGTIEAHRLSTGDKQWSRQVDWAGFGGTDNDVVIAGRTGKQHGFDAIDPDSGVVRWSDGAAIGAWTYTNLIVSIACPGPSSCKLTARSPESGAVKWTTGLSGNGRTLSGANKTLSGPRPFDVAVTSAQPAPPLLGFPIDGQVQVVASSSGRRLHTYASDKDTRVVVAGDRVVVSSVTSQDGSCRFSTEGRDPDGDRRVWRLDGYDLRTSSGLGCEQRSDPIGGGGLLDAVAPDGHEVLLDESTGRRVLQVATGETMLGSDGRLVLVRSADGQTVRAVRTGGSTSWTRPAGKSVRVDFGPGVVLFTDPDNEKIVALSSQGSTLIDVKSGATQLGYAEDGLVIHIGLRVGLLNYHGSAG